MRLLGNALTSQTRTASSSATSSPRRVTGWNDHAIRWNQRMSCCQTNARPISAPAELTELPAGQVPRRAVPDSRI